MNAIVEIPAQDYHADEVGDRPSLSKSVIHTLIEKSPAHAWEAHPKLNPDFARVDDDKFDLGTAVHALLLEPDISRVVAIPYDDWRTKAAKEEREIARQHGLIPMLAKNYEACEQMLITLTNRCHYHPQGPFFAYGEAEKTLVWTDEYDVLCRARLDWLNFDPAHPELAQIDDLKTTRASASPDAWSRTAFSIGADLQVAWYLRGCEKVLGCRPEFRFVVVEVDPPWALSVFSLAPDALALADKKIDYALKLWATCLRNDAWPGYPERIAHITTPPWVEAAWLERELREVAA